LVEPATGQTITAQRTLSPGGYLYGRGSQFTAAILHQAALTLAALAERASESSIPVREISSRIGGLLQSLVDRLGIYLIPVLDLAEG
jgi:hypothetical protein